ncbi:MAG: heavy metal translocating P-type ATPase [Calditrichia bacterium]
MNTPYKENILRIKGMDCADCAIHIEKAISKLNGIEFARVDFINSHLQVKYNPDLIRLPEIEQAVKASGYELEKGEDTQKTILEVQGMDCADEARPIEKKLRSLPGVIDVQFNLIAHQVTVEHTLPVSKIQDALKKIGFTSRIVEQASTFSPFDKWRDNRKTILTVISGFFAFAGIALNFLDIPPHFTIPLFLISIMTGGYFIFIKGWKEARRLTLGMDFLMSLAVIGAMIIGEWSEAAVVIFLFSLAQLLESFSVERARKSIYSLMELAPNVASLKTDRGEELVPVEQINTGDVIIVKPGERIPLDGIVVAGHSTVNQAPITGESLPRETTVGDEVFAGTINQFGALEIQVSRVASDSTLAHIIRLVETAQAQKAPSQYFVEKFARYYTPAVVSAAILIAIIPPLFFGQLFTEWFYRALVVLVISCPCALVISTPVTIVSGLAKAARSGILIKGGTHLEGFDRIKVLAFDKTGTITRGEPRVQSIITLNNTGEKELLQIVSAIESRSEHPLARAILEYSRSKGIPYQPVDQFELLAGRGARGTFKGKTYYVGNHRLFEENHICDSELHADLELVENRNHTAVIVGNEEKILGIISIGDEVREKAQEAISELKQNGIRRTVLLTGDNFTTAEAIARQVGIDEYFAELLPQDKVKVMKKLLDEYEAVAMVGDGINDAPALATATIGISMGYSGTDTALETADVALMNDDLTRLPFLKRLSSKTGVIIKQNILIALFLKALFFALAVPGWATLWMAVFADMGASLLVIFNGLRVLSFRG